MLIIKNEDFKQLSVFDQLLPKSCLELKGELAVVDKILDDETFLTPFIEKFNSKCGRHSTPVDTYIRMMYLKFRYNLGYETLCKEVSYSISWKVFCHIPVCAKYLTKDRNLLFPGASIAIFCHGCQPHNYP
jgi:IS5 family transposase